MANLLGGVLQESVHQSSDFPKLKQGQSAMKGPLLGSHLARGGPIHANGHLSSGFQNPGSSSTKAAARKIETQLNQ